MNVTSIRFVGGAVSLLILAAGLWPGSELKARPLDALDVPWSISAAPDGGIWVALQTDTVAGLSYYPPDRSSHRDLMAWVWEPSLAVSDDRDLYVGGHSASMQRGSRIVQFSADGRHQRSWARHPTVIVDLDITADDELASLEVDLDSEDAHVWPPVADRIVRYSLMGQRLSEEHFDDSMTQLAAAKDGSLHVARRANRGGTHIVQLLPDGSTGATLDLDGDVVGMDLDEAGLLYVAEVSDAGHGGVGRFRIIGGAFSEIGSWDACHEPRDLAR